MKKLLILLTTLIGISNLSYGMNRTPRTPDQNNHPVENIQAPPAINHPVEANWAPEELEPIPFELPTARGQRPRPFAPQDALFEVVERDNAADFQQIIQELGVNLNTQDENGRSIVSHAIASKSTSIINYLLNNHAQELQITRAIVQEAQQQASEALGTNATSALARVITTYQQQNQEEGQTCTICLEACDNSFSLSCCGLPVHAQCFNQWLYEHRNNSKWRCICREHLATLRNKGAIVHPKERLLVDDFLLDDEENAQPAEHLCVSCKDACTQQMHLPCCDSWIHPDCYIDALQAQISNEAWHCAGCNQALTFEDGETETASATMQPHNL